MRKKSKGHSGLRAGVLKARPRTRGRRSLFAPPVFLLCACLAPACVSCGGRDAGKQGAPGNTDTRAAWYQLQEGKLAKLAAIDAALPVLPQPWTVQSRVTDAAAIGKVLVMSVNGYGLAALDLGGNAPAVSYFHDPAIFSHRTMTTLVRTGAGLTVHLYFNQMLNTVDRSALKIGGISLVGFMPESGEYAFIMPPFQARNPDWEAVGFVAPVSDEYYFEWKKWGESETRFAYSRFRPDEGKEESITRDEYLGKYKAYSAATPGGGEARKALFNKVREIIKPDQSSAVHFTLRSRDYGVKLVFRGGEGATSVTMVPVWEEKDRVLALMPDNALFWTADGLSFGSVPLPPLPGGFHYTDLYMDDGVLVVPWEQTLFTDVRAAGLLIFRP